MKLLSITLATLLAAAVALPIPNDGATGLGSLVKKQIGLLILAPDVDDGSVKIGLGKRQLGDDAAVNFDTSDGKFGTLKATTSFEGGGKA